MNRTSTAAAVDYGPHEVAMQAYLREGEERALALGNRGPIRFDASGALHPDILAAFSRCGFYVFEDVLAAEELADVESDFHDVLERLPVEKGSPVDRRGRPALGFGCEAPTLFWSKPLGDPFGGTSQASRRHPVKMTEPTPADDAPAEVVYLILGSLQFSDAALRVYGHPKLLGVAAAVNGEDFVPFNEAMFIKEPGRGASVAWHQDGVTHWDSPDWDEGSHGFNVTDPQTRTPDPEMAERIRYHALAEGLVMICVKNYIRIAPPLVMTHDEVDDLVGRLGVAIERAKAGRPTGTDFSTSSSLAADPVRARE